MDISIVLPTYKRLDILSKTLKSFQDVDTQDLTWEILVVDNAVDQVTNELVESFKKVLPIQYLTEKNRGKNYALNHAIGFVKGDLIVLTDDDIIADPSWLQEYKSGVARWPKYDVFGGRIVPRWPSNDVPFQGVEEEFFRSSFSIADWNIEEGPYSSGKVWGPNMAVRRRIFEKGHRFDIYVGPSGDNYIMGSETEFTKRMERNGYASVYLPKVKVLHQIREEQIKPKWIYNRAWKYARAEIYHEEKIEVKSIFGAPRYLYKSLFEVALKRLMLILSNKRSQRIILGIRYWMLRGKIYQYRQMQHS